MNAHGRLSGGEMSQMEMAAKYAIQSKRMIDADELIGKLRQMRTDSMYQRGEVIIAISRIIDMVDEMTNMINREKRIGEEKTDDKEGGN